MPGTLLEFEKTGSMIDKISEFNREGEILHLVVLQSLSHVQLFATPWTAAHQASLSITNSQSLLKLMSIESVMPSSHLILCRPLQVAKVLEFQLQPLQ